MMPKMNFFTNVILRQLPIFYRTYVDKASMGRKIQVIGIVRERNEELLLGDTLDHLSQFVDAIVVFDDASSDGSFDIAKSHPAVVEVIQNRWWRRTNRLWEETSNRRKLLSCAKRYNPDWFFYADADERFEGNIKQYLLKECPQDVNAIRVSLFDAYLTPSDNRSYSSDEKLYNFRKNFGPERRDIIMLWRNVEGVNYEMKDAREPQNIKGNQLVRFYCQHYGKGLSVGQWEETCDYYVDHFPKYKDKWYERKGKAIHERSDFNRPLYTWDKVKNNSVKI